LPIVGKQQADIDGRAAFFKEVIGLLTGSSAFNHLEIQYHSEVHKVISHVYFALSEAYKRQFLHDGAGTDPTKQAALTCAAICAVKPLRPLPTNKVHYEHIYINQMLAMRCACIIIDHPIQFRTWDEQRRIYMQMDRFMFPSVKPILEEAATNNGEIKSNFKITLSPQEEATLKGLISLFEAYKSLKG
jgi:hypothetical protein